LRTVMRRPHQYFQQNQPAWYHWSVVVDTTLWRSRYSGIANTADMKLLKVFGDLQRMLMLNFNRFVSRRISFFCWTSCQSRALYARLLSPKNEKQQSSSRRAESVLMWFLIRDHCDLQYSPLTYIQIFVIFSTLQIYRFLKNWNDRKSILSKVAVPNLHYSTGTGIAASKECLTVKRAQWKRNVHCSTTFLSRWARTR
jgi:hypothetical protein